MAPQLVARKWTYPRKQRSSRSGVLAELRRLVVRMAAENPAWGYTRIQGALKNVGHHVGRSTVARILKAHGLPPVPNRPTSWQTFLRAHWGAIGGADFFTTEVWTVHGLVTFYTAFVSDFATRRVQVLGITPHPDDAFMYQLVRTLTMSNDWRMEGSASCRHRIRRRTRTPTPSASCARSRKNVSTGLCRSAKGFASRLQTSTRHRGPSCDAR
jgi:HTH-like domain